MYLRWELNDMAPRLDNQPNGAKLREELVSAPGRSGAGFCPNGQRMLETIENLPEDEREAFDLVRIQGMTQFEAAKILGVSTVIVKRRLNCGLRLLMENLGDLRPADDTPDKTS
jgi:RNA polymerase sigma-70 factor (ECF subfamily)